MPEYRRGLTAIQDAAESKGGGNFRQFVPEIKWREDGEKKYILILTPIDEVPALDLHEWIPVGKVEKANGESYTKWETFLSRRDPLLGESEDELEDRLGRRPKTRCMGVGVELEPVMETVRGRQRPKGFSVKTSTFTRHTEDGEEEVTQPEIGLIVQSSALVWSPLASFDLSQGPLEALPFEVIRRNKNRDTRYDFVPFMDIPVDLSPVIDHLEGVTYLAENMADVVAAVEAEEDETKQAQVVAMALLDRRLEELADKGRYDELVGPIKEIPDKFGGGNKKADSRPSRPARPSPRAKVEDTPAEEAPEPSKAERFAALKARVEK